MARITLSAIKADVGSLAGHIVPSRELVKAVGDHIKANQASLGIIDFRLSTTGDDVCILMTHRHGADHPQIQSGF